MKPPQPTKPDVNKKATSPVEKSGIDKIAADTQRSSSRPLPSLTRGMAGANNDGTSHGITQASMAAHWPPHPSLIFEQFEYVNFCAGLTARQTNTGSRGHDACRLIAA
jgi:hypothetical protein